MKKLNVIFCLLTIVAVCGSVNGETVEWFNLNNSTNWSTYGNWGHYATGTYSTPPTSADEVLIGDRGWGGTVVVNVAAAADIMKVGDGASWNGQLDVQNSLTATTGIYVAVYTNTSTVNLNSVSGSINTQYLWLGHTGGNGTVNMSAGSINCGNTIAVGYYAGGASTTGQLNMSGGTINTGSLHLGMSDAVGNVFLSGGTIYTSWFEVGAPNHTNTGTLNLSGTGKMVIDSGFKNTDYWMSLFNDYNGTKILNAQAQVVGNTVEITAIPEPATMFVLGLGSLLPLRRRK